MSLSESDMFLLYKTGCIRIIILEKCQIAGRTAMKKKMNELRKINQMKVVIEFSEEQKEYEQLDRDIKEILTNILYEYI